jgi:hypothetical protein
MDRITGSKRPTPEMVSLRESQKNKAASGVDPGFGRSEGLPIGKGGGTGGGAGVEDAAGAGVGVRWVASTDCEGTTPTGGIVGRGAELGADTAVTMAANLSIRCSISDTRFGVCTTVLGFAGLLRATCSIQPVRAF